MLEHVWSREEDLLDSMPLANRLPPDNNHKEFWSFAIPATVHQPRPSPTQVCMHTDITDGGDYRLHVGSDAVTDTDTDNYNGVWFSW